MTDTSYFHTLTPRQQLNDLMHKYAQVNGIPYGESWREFERRYYRRHRVRISYMKYLYCRDHRIRMTTPAFLETANALDSALEIAHDMAGHIIAIPETTYDPEGGCQCSSKP